ncbi:MAG: hypothetical protein C4583_03945 [Anaerolineaceae bacterium]|nr:MAG: hypothetical protein C4583_03945 [Anaerolineaceae bacterium]
MGDYPDVVESEKYAIERLEISQIRVSDSTVEIVPDFVILKNRLAEKRIQFIERFMTVAQYWGMSDEFPARIGNLLRLHHAVIGGGFYLDKRSEELVKDLQSECESYSLEQGLSYRKEFDSLPLLVEISVTDADARAIENPDEVLENEFVSAGRPIFEGAVKKVTVNAYERNPKARKACISHYGFSCTVCGMNFEKMYGEVGKKYIHVHHLKLVSDIKEEYEVDPINDLRPVCPNCHAMIHRQNPPYSIDEVKSFIEKSSNKENG